MNKIDRRQLSAFARERVAATIERRASSEAKELHDLFAGAFDAGVGACIYGGKTDLPALFDALYLLAREGRDLGFNMSLTVHLLLAQTHLARCADSPVVAAALEQARTGQCVLAFAVSEHERGAHPRFQKSRAVPIKGGYSLQGLKTFITNGPEADHILAFCISEEIGDRFGFTGFLLDRGMDGLDADRPIALPFCQTSPHGELKMDGCIAGRERIVGPERGAYETMIKPFRGLEDFMAGLLAGAADRIRNKGVELDDETALAFGAFVGRCETLGVLAQNLGARARLPNYEEAPLLPALIGFRTAADDAIAVFNKLPKSLLGNDPILARIKSDLQAASIGGNVFKIKTRKLGRS